MRSLGWAQCHHNDILRPRVSAQSSSCVPLFAAPWTTVCLAPLPMQFPRQEYWSGLPFPPPGNFPNPRIKPTSQVSPTLAGGFFTTSTTWEALQPRELRLICSMPYLGKGKASVHVLTAWLFVSDAMPARLHLLVATTLAKSIKTTIKVVICLHSWLHSVKSSQHDIVG